MAKDAMLRCPLCQGDGQVRHSQLSNVLVDQELRTKLEKYAGELLAEQNKSGVVGANGSRDFNKEVHSWNPQLPIWRRSPKE